MKKKILIIVENASVPFDTRVWKEAASLHGAGHEVTVVCPRAKEAESGHEIIDGIRVYRHPMPQERNGALGYLWEYSCALLLGVLVRVVDLYSAWFSRHPRLQSS